MGTWLNRRAGLGVAGLAARVLLQLRPAVAPADALVSNVVGGAVHDALLLVQVCSRLSMAGEAARGKDEHAKEGVVSKHFGGTSAKSSVFTLDRTA